MQQCIYEGTLYRDNNKRYCLHELDIPAGKTFTCTSGCPIEVWLNHSWITGHVESDGEDYWLFADGGGKFLLAEHMRARYALG